MIPRFVEDLGYILKGMEPFEIYIDLPASANKDQMKTYTVRPSNQKRIQVSGPIMMPWYLFSLAKT